MDKVRDYRRRAEECRQVASTVAPELKQHYEELAEMWDRLADERAHFVSAKDEKAK